MKKVISLLISAAMLITLSGCASENPTPIEGETTTTQSTPLTQVEAPEYENSGIVNALVVSLTRTNTWKDGDYTYCQFDGILENNSDTDLNGWEVGITIPPDVEVFNSWNAEYSLSGTTLTAVNVDYNSSVPSGTSTTFGVILKCKYEIKGSVCTINGVATDYGEEGAEVTTDGTSASSSVTTAKTTSTKKVTSPTEATTKKPTATVTTKETTTATTKTPSSSAASNLVSSHGQLSVNGTQLVDSYGKAFQLYGMSTHGIQWFPDFANKNIFKTLRDDWGTNVIRLAMYTGNSEGYNDSTKAGIEKKVTDCIDMAIELDMYVIVDWHVLADGTPQTMQTDAMRFFTQIASKYGSYPNVIYEICNEPNGGNVTWSGNIKPYATEVIKTIRAIDSDSVIIVGTPTWSQDIDKAASDPLNFNNIMYALHFYAATHTDWLRDRLTQCHLNGLPVIVSEFGMCDASGAGSNNFTEATKWLNLLDEYGISYINWALANKDETCCALKSNASSDGVWDSNEISEGGKWIRDWFKNKSE